MVPNSPHPLRGYESWFLDFQGGDVTNAPTWISSGLHFLLQLISLRKPKVRFFLDLANALRIKTTSPSEILPMFIFWPKHLFSWYYIYGSFLNLICYFYLFSLDSSVQFNCSVVSDSLRPHESQHARPPCPSQTPRVYSNSCPSSQWCHPAISSSVVPSCLQSLPASGSFPMSQLFTWGGQSIGVSASASVLPINTQDLSPSGWTGWISLQSKGLSRVFSNTTVQKHQLFSAQLSSQSNSHIHTWPLEKP